MRSGPPTHRRSHTSAGGPRGVEPSLRLGSQVAGDTDHEAVGQAATGAGRPSPRSGSARPRARAPPRATAAPTRAGTRAVLPTRRLLSSNVLPSGVEAVRPPHPNCAVVHLTNLDTVTGELSRVLVMSSASWRPRTAPGSAYNSWTGSGSGSAVLSCIDAKVLRLPARRRTRRTRPVLVAPQPAKNSRRTGAVAIPLTMCVCPGSSVSVPLGR
jgi:hypothetical protein